MTETIPARVTEVRIGKLRHDIEVPQQNAVEGFGCRHQTGAILGKDHLIDQFVDGRILDADDILRTRLIRGL